MIKKLIGVILVLAIAMTPDSAVILASTTTNVSTEEKITEDGLPILDSTFRSEPNEDEIAEMIENGNYNVANSSKIIKPNMTLKTASNTYKIYGTTKITSYSTVPKYHFLGEVSAYNNTSHNTSLQYKQVTTVTTNWSVCASATGEIGISFLAGVKFTAGIAVTTSKTTAQSSESLYSITVSPKKSASIKAYRKGIQASGAISWTEYSIATGGVVSTGTTAVYGTTVMENGLHFEASEY